jgi:hypothetical protein
VVSALSQKERSDIRFGRRRCSPVWDLEWGNSDQPNRLSSNPAPKPELLAYHLVGMSGIKR